MIRLCSNRSLTLGALLLVQPAAAQVEAYYGPSPNLVTVLDFDTPALPLGPLAPGDPALAAAGIASIALVGTALPHSGDVLSPGENVHGRSLVVEGGSIAVGEAGTPIQGFDDGNGIEFALLSPAEEFQVLMADVRGVEYDVDLYLGGTWLGQGQFLYEAVGQPIPPHYWRSAGGPFDRVVVTFPSDSTGVGFDEIAFGNGPALTPHPSDECLGAAVVTSAGTSGFTFFNQASTASLPPMSCSATAGADHWIRFVVQEHSDVDFLATATGIAVLEVYSGACGALASIACVAGTSQSDQLVTSVFDAVAGDEYYVRVGVERSVRGSVDATVRPRRIDPAPLTCVESRFTSTEPGALGGAVYFDLNCSLPITIAALKTNSSHPPGTPLGLEVWVTPGSRVGKESDSSLWTRVALDDGQSASEGPGRKTTVGLLEPFDLAAGSYGLALVGSNSSSGLDTDFRSSELGPQGGAVQSGDGVLSLDLGAESDQPFGNGTVEGRLWNGRLCYTKSSIGINYCGPAVIHNGGYPAWMCASGTPIAANNDLVLEAVQLPLNTFGYFIVSRTHGMVPMAGGSLGTLCLGGSIGRYVGPGQVQTSGSTGQFSVPIDLAETPTPTGLVHATAGETWNFQCWFRDGYEFGVLSNFTDGLEITLE